MPSLALEKILDIPCTVQHTYNFNGTRQDNVSNALVFHAQGEY